MQPYIDLTCIITHWDVNERNLVYRAVTQVTHQHQLSIYVIDSNAIFVIKFEMVVLLATVSVNYFQIL